MTRAPAVRVVDQRLLPERRAVDRPRREALGVEAVRSDDAAARIDAQQALGALELAVRKQQQALAAQRPAAHPAFPRRGVVPAGRRAVRDALEHEQLGAVQMADDRDAGRHARGRLVDRGQVVQVQDVGVGGARVLQCARPGGDVGLVGVVVEGGEDAVGSVGAVLVGGVHRRLAAVEAHRVDVAALVEMLGVTETGERSRDHGHLAAVRGQLAGQRPRHVRRAAARKEHEGGEHAHPPVVPEVVTET